MGVIFHRNISLAPSLPKNHASRHVLCTACTVACPCCGLNVRVPSKCTCGNLFLSEVVLGACDFEWILRAFPSWKGSVSFSGAEMSYLVYSSVQGHSRCCLWAKGCHWTLTQWVSWHWTSLPPELWEANSCCFKIMPFLMCILRQFPWKI